MTTLRLLDELKLDLALLDCFDNQIEAIKASHLAEIKALQPKQKRVIATKPKEHPLKCEITEAGKTTVVIFQTEKECETFLKLKQKQRFKTAQSPLGIEVPFIERYGGSYANKRETLVEKEREYWKASEDQNLIFNVKISRA